MIKYLFKGISANSGQWVIGCYCYDPETDSHLITDPRNHDYKVKVKEETLCMSTGLYDQTGKAVFENDVLQGKALDSTGKEIASYLKLVSLRDGTFYVSPDKHIGNNIKDFLSDSIAGAEDKARCKVIANIYDPDYSASRKGRM
jgi:uncharacterized phage protein (TIGR01671 family)